MSFGKKKLVTSALPYVHGIPHLGNLSGSILPADIYHRFLDVRGLENYYFCGSDVHGTPSALAAMEEGEEPKEFTQKQHRKIKSVLEEFNIDFTHYSQTHTSYNRKQTQKMFKQLYRNGYIAEKTQNLPYCRNDERFLPDRYIEGECPHCGGLARGDQCDDCGKLLEPEEIIEPYCTICEERDIEFRDTKNLFLQLPKFEEELKEWIKEKDPIPERKKEEVLNLIEEGLEDRCITRDIEWGFDVPTEEFDELDDETYEDKVLYVWFDAPIGYIGITREYFDKGSDESRWNSFWKHDKAENIYSIGKDNTIFHTIIWPAILMGQQEDYNLPEYEFIQEFLLAEDTKFSKSRGKGFSTEEALELLPEDYWRFHFSSVLPVKQDTRFSWNDFESKINGTLNDAVGNYVNRVLSLAEKWFDGKVPQADSEEFYKEAEEFYFGDEGIAELVKDYEKAVEEDRNIKKGLEKAVELARKGDEFLSEEEPWNHDEKQEEIIYICLQSLRALAVALYPYIPSSAEKIWRMLYPGENELNNGQKRLEEVRGKENFIEPGHSLGKKEILFEKVDAEELRSKIEDNDTEGEKDMSDTISFEEFQKMDLRTGTIKEVEDHPNADKLYVMQVDLGGETRQSCAGLKNHFEPEELEGKQVAVVYNLETSELRGKKSECMILAVDDDDQVVPLKPEKEVSNGMKIR